MIAAWISERFIHLFFPVFTVFVVFQPTNLYAGPIAEGCDKFLGNISTSGPPSNFLNYWNQVTLENNGKWVNVEPNRDQMNWGPTQQAYDFCQKNNIPFKHHTFLWNEQAPNWIKSLPAAQQKEEVEEFIREYGKRFPNTAFIDVVNEAINKSPSWKGALGGDGETGYDWMVWAFAKAREYCPNAKLLINEYYCEYDLERVTEYLKMINVLKERDLIDGIGLQTHDGETKKGFGMGTLRQCLDSLATSGLPLYSTEFDMAGSDDEQLKWYQDIFPIIWEHPAVRGVTLWGWTDSWLLRISNPKDARLIINGRERPALKWLREYVAEHKTTIPTYTRESMHIIIPDKAVMRVTGIPDGGYRIRFDQSTDGTARVQLFDLMGRNGFSRRVDCGRGPVAISVPRSAGAAGTSVLRLRKGTAEQLLQAASVR